VRKAYAGADYYPDAAEVNEISRLSLEKYAAWEWTYGWSPDYAFTNELTNNQLKVKISLRVHRGVITGIDTEGSRSDVIRALNLLTGTRHSEGNIRSVLENAGLKKSLQNEMFEDLVFTFF